MIDNIRLLIFKNISSIVLFNEQNLDQQNLNGSRP